MRSFILGCVALVTVFVLVGCGGSAPKAGGTDTGETVVNVPIWYAAPPTDPNYLYQPSSATSTSMQIAIDKATMSGRTGIAQQMELKIEGLQKRFTEETGTAEDAQILEMFTSATKTIVSTTLNGSKVKSQEIRKAGNVFTAYILVEYPIGAANEALMKAIKSNNQTYTRFRASESFKELDDQVKKYEDFKKTQQQP